MLMFSLAAYGAGWMNAGAGSAATAITGNRLLRANAILDRWEPLAERAGARVSGWREMLQTQIVALDDAIVDDLDGLPAPAPAPAPADATDARRAYADFAAALRTAVLQSYVARRSGRGHIKLGSTTTDQVFIAVTPCRIVDTRLGGGGQIAAGSTRNFNYYAVSPGDGFTTQGGTASASCPETINPNGGPPSAAAVTATVVNASAAGNWVLWGGAPPLPSVSALNWNAGEVKSNTTVVSLGGRSGNGPGGPIKDFAVSYNGPSGAADFIADVVGYFVENRVTALDCLETATQSQALANNTSAEVYAPACPASYAMTGGDCDADNMSGLTFDGQYYAGAFPQAHWICAYRNGSGSTRTVYASSICCRVPGR